VSDAVKATIASEEARSQHRASSFIALQLSAMLLHWSTRARAQLTFWDDQGMAFGERSDVQECKGLFVIYKLE
jgi:hypothetical protein